MIAFLNSIKDEQKLNLIGDKDQWEQISKATQQKYV